MNRSAAFVSWPISAYSRPHPVGSGFDTIPSEDRSALGVVFKSYDACQHLYSSKLSVVSIKDWIAYNTLEDAFSSDTYLRSILAGTSDWGANNWLSFNTDRFRDNISLRRFWQFTITIDPLFLRPRSSFLEVARQSDLYLDDNIIWPVGGIWPVGSSNAFYYISSKNMYSTIRSVYSVLKQSIEDGSFSLDKIRWALRENIRVKVRIRGIRRPLDLVVEISSTHRWVHEFFLLTGISPPRTVLSKLASQLRSFTVPTRGGRSVPNLRSSSRRNRRGCVAWRTSKINRQGDLRRVDADLSVQVARRHQHIRVCPPGWGALRRLGG